MERMTLEEIARAVGCAGRFEGAVEEISTDSRRIPAGCLFVAIPGERFDGHDFVAKAAAAGARWALVERPCDTGSIPPERVLTVPDARQALVRIAGAYRAKFDLRCVGVTGSVGKTTTKDMVAEVLSAKYKTLKNEGNLNNEIGLPQTLFRLDGSFEAAVIEMGMQRLGEIAALAAAARPELGVITSIGVSHIETLGSRENILKAKLELAEALPDGAPLLLCGDNDLLAAVRIPRLDVRFYGIDNPACALRAEGIAEEGGRTSFTLRHPGGSVRVAIPAVGRHNVCDALAACGAGLALGIPAEECAAALGRYTPSGMRQRVVEHGGYTVVEDCYNASPDSMAAALATLGGWACGGRRVAVLADMLELGPIAREAHRQVGRLAAENGVDLLLCYGPLARGYAEGAAGVEAICFDDKAALTEELRRRLRPGDVVWVKGSHGMALEEVLQGLYTA